MISDIRPNAEYKVITRCFTYNQSKYIEDALNGFVMQKTNFPFVCVIIDDASTDGEQDVIKAFLEREFDFTEDDCKETDDAQVIVAKHKTNTNCTFAVYFLKENHYSIKRSKDPYLNPWREKCKYEALCEGDDYWIEPLKLQKQYEILENNPNVSMVFHRARIKNELSIPIYIKCDNITNREYSATEIFENWIVPTASVIYRKECRNYPIKNRKNILYGDIFLFEQCAHMGKVRGMSECMSVYRMQEHGVVYDKDRILHNIFCLPEHNKCIAANFPKIDRNVNNKLLAISYWNRANYQTCITDRINDVYNGIMYGTLRITLEQIKKRIKARISCLF